MCDKCPCSSFSAHLWKPGECRDCHHSITEHAIVPVDTASSPSPLLSSTSSSSLDTTFNHDTQKHTFVGKLSVDKLEPFSHPSTPEASPLLHSTSLGRLSVTITPPLRSDQSATRLSVNNNITRDTTRLQPEQHDNNKEIRSGQHNTMRKSASFKGIGINDNAEGMSPGTYEQRLSASFRKSREIQAKRKSSTDLVGDNSKDAHRGLIIEELVVTERDYCRDLDYLIQVCTSPERYQIVIMCLYSHLR